MKKECRMALPFAVLLLLSSCAKTPQGKSEPGIDVIPGQSRGRTQKPDETPKQDYVVVSVHYGTDRAVSGSGEPNSYYETGRSSLQFGRVDVSIPKRHRAGEMESPSWLRFEFREDPNKHIMLLELAPLSLDEFTASIHKEMKEGRGRGDLFVFVHGFQNDFRACIRRTAQLAYDLNFPGIPVAYSWPSQGRVSPLAYTQDEATTEWTSPHFKEFLLQLRSIAGTNKIHILAHSMGNRILARALIDIAREKEGRLFNQVVMAAPDIDAQTFYRDILPVITNSATRITLYASSSDRALAISKKVHGYPRAGDSGNSMIIAEGLDTVDATGIDTALLGLRHAYYSECVKVIRDIIGVSVKELKPPERDLEGRKSAGLPYWVFPENGATEVLTGKEETESFEDEEDSY